MSFSDFARIFELFEPFFYNFFFIILRRNSIFKGDFFKYEAKFRFLGKTNIKILFSITFCEYFESSVWIPNKISFVIFILFIVNLFYFFVDFRFKEKNSGENTKKVFSFRRNFLRLFVYYYCIFTNFIKQKLE